MVRAFRTSEAVVSTESLSQNGSLIVREKIRDENHFKPHFLPSPSLRLLRQASVCVNYKWASFLIYLQTRLRTNLDSSRNSEHDLMSRSLFTQAKSSRRSTGNCFKLPRRKIISSPEGVLMSLSFFLPPCRQTATISTRIMNHRTATVRNIIPSFNTSNQTRQMFRHFHVIPSTHPSALLRCRLA